MATQTVKRAIEIETDKGYLDNVGRPIATQTAEQPKERRVGFLSRVADALWRASCGFSLAGLFLPPEPAFRHCSTLSPKEKAEIEAYLMGL
jgi:hypothetical protein